MVELEIDGQTLTVVEGTTIIEAADSVGIYIPRYCYHKKLSVAANCRMCLVEVDKVGKPLPACATPVTQDMKVMTRSAKALAAQRDVLEFLLINHPLDCPICDQGGVCELQDFAMGYGKGHSNFKEDKISTTISNIGPLVDTWMTRCIKCTRCVRFGEEIAGMRELGVINRGEQAEISAYLPSFVDSELSANITDICPVGALTVKPSRYQDRNWELLEHPSVAPHDCVGSNVYLHTQGDAHRAQRVVVNVVPKENDEVNESWLSDRDRFAFYGLRHSDRCYQPMMMHKKACVESTWGRVLPEIADRLLAIVQQQGPEQVAFIASPHSTTQELYLLQKIARALGCDNVDHRLRQQDFHDAEQMTCFSSDLSLPELEESDCIVLVGSNVRFEQPLVSHRVRKASLNEACIFAINPVDFVFNFDLSATDITVDVVNSLAKLAKALGVDDAALSTCVPEAFHEATAKAILQSEKPTLLLGLYAIEHPHAMSIRALVHAIEFHTKVNVGWLTQGANTAGAWRAGAVPHRDASGKNVPSPGRTALSLLSDKPVRAYVLMNVEPEYDVVDSASAIEALGDAGLVVSLGLYASQKMKEVADFMLPVAPFFENAGSYTNVAGVEQAFVAASVPSEECKPAWKVLRALATYLELDGFSYRHVGDVNQELAAIDYRLGHEVMALELPEPPSSCQRYAYLPMYDSDSMVRRSQPLSESNLKRDLCVSLNKETAARFNLGSEGKVRVRQGAYDVVLPFVIDDALATGVVALPAIASPSMGMTFGCGHGDIELEEVSC